MFLVRSDSDQRNNGERIRVTITTSSPYIKQRKPARAGSISTSVCGTGTISTLPRGTTEPTRTSDHAPAAAPGKHDILDARALIGGKLHVGGRLVMRRRILPRPEVVLLSRGLVVPLVLFRPLRGLFVSLVLLGLLRRPRTLSIGLRLGGPFFHRLQRFISSARWLGVPAFGFRQPTAPCSSAEEQRAVAQLAAPSLLPGPGQVGSGDQCKRSNACEQ
jgi:hypothetical protein